MRIASVVPDDAPPDLAASGSHEQLPSGGGTQSRDVLMTQSSALDQPAPERRASGGSQLQRRVLSNVANVPAATAAPPCRQSSELERALSASGGRKRSRDQPPQLLDDDVFQGLMGNSTITVPRRHRSAQLAGLALGSMDTVPPPVESPTKPAELQQPTVAVPSVAAPSPATENAAVGLLSLRSKSLR